VRLKGPIAVATGRSTDIKIEPSALIDVIKERFGTDSPEAGVMFLHQVREAAIANESLGQTSTGNTLNNFRYGFVTIRAKRNRQGRTCHVTRWALQSAAKSVRP
jgi:hypothetical protein